MLNHKRNISVLLISVFVALLSSCNKTHYGTSVSVQNYLPEEILVEVYPRETPYSPSTLFDIPSGNESTILNTGVTDQTPQDLLRSTFDSIAIRFHELEDYILFTPDTVINYLFNPYWHPVIWESRTVEYDVYDMTKHHHEDDNFYFKIAPDLII